MNARFINLEPFARFICLPVITISCLIGSLVFLARGGWYAAAGTAALVGLAVAVYNAFRR